MSYDETRALLDQLMGEGRNGDDNLLSDKPFTDDVFCKMYLCGLCPYEMFTNTKIDMGNCDKKHLESKREEYQAAKEKGENYGFERELYFFLKKLADECDRRIRKGQQRLLETQGPEDEDILSLQIKDFMKQAEALGEEGNVDESMAMMAKVEELKRQKIQVDKDKRMADTANVLPNGIQQQKLRVCEACGSFLSLYDNERRLQDHYSGKLHTGFALLRRKIEQLEKERHLWDRPVMGGGRPDDRRRDDRDRHRDDRYDRRRDDRHRRDDRRDYDRHRSHRDRDHHRSRDRSRSPRRRRRSRSRSPRRSPRRDERY